MQCNYCGLSHSTRGCPIRAEDRERKRYQRRITYLKRRGITPTEANIRDLTSHVR